MNFLVTNFQSDNVKLKNFDNTDLFFYSENDDRFKIEKKYLFFLKGYLLKDKKPINFYIPNSNRQILLEKWPYPDNFSGSFGLCFVINNEIIISNDCIGLYPIYYYKKKKTLVVSNNLTLIQKVLKLSVDQVGAFQRKHAPEYSNLGNRTLLQDVKRLLPGEKIRFDISKNSLESYFDNRLYKNIKTSDLKVHSIFEYWENYVNEVKGASDLNGKPINIALSGGMDSRLVLGAMPMLKSKAFTYGETDSYEVKISQRLAFLKGIKFISNFDKKNYFPSKNKISDVILNSGPPSVMSFFDIEEVAPKNRELLLLGDMCESLPARNIKKFSSRKSRQENFLKHFILNKPYHLKRTSKDEFSKWKSLKRKNLRKYLLKSTRLYQIDNLDDLISKTLQDLDSILERVEKHDIKYAELYDELFTWYTHARIPMSKQILHCDLSFYAVAPSMGSDILIRTSNIHPNDRLNYRFMNKLFKKVECLQKLNAIPTSQSPLIGRNSFGLMQFMIWGLRSKADQLLIKRLMKKKDPGLRYRLFKSLNWVDIYQQEDLQQRIEKYFENNILGDDYLNAILKKATQRKNLESWPLTNLDIMSISILNLELDILLNTKVKL